MLAGGQAVLHGDGLQVRVVFLLGRIEDDANIHHDVDEQAVLGQERAQVLALWLEPQRQGLPGLNNHRLHRRVAGQVVPALPGGPEEETQVMNAAVCLAGLDQAGVMFGSLPPARVAGVLVQQPQLPAQKAFAPVGPGFALEVPFSLEGIQGEEIGVLESQAIELPGCIIKNLVDL